MLFDSLGLKHLIFYRFHIKWMIIIIMRPFGGIVIEAGGF
ncbi:hypothetical protein Leryth_027199 [Lithospermum erythrorhizon]|nr:hypothetical protein Leryth_027199 [Lithospermum erythrorhizon]